MIADAAYFRRIEVKAFSCYDGKFGFVRKLIKRLNMKNQKNQPLRVKRQLTKEELDAIYQYADSMGMGTSEGLESGLASDDITFMESIWVTGKNVCIKKELV